MIKNPLVSIILRIVILLLLIVPTLGAAVELSKDLQEKKHLPHNDGEIFFGGGDEEFNNFDSENRNAIRRAFQANVGLLKKCFQKSKEKKVEVIVRINLESSGKVHSVSFISSSLKDKMIGRCLLSGIQKIMFPQTNTGEELQMFEYPIKFLK